MTQHPAAVCRECADELAWKVGSMSSTLDHRLEIPPLFRPDNPPSASLMDTRSTWTGSNLQMKQKHHFLPFMQRTSCNKMQLRKLMLHEAYPCIQLAGFPD